MKESDADRARAARRLATAPRLSHRLAALGAAIVLLLPDAGVADDAKRLAKARTWIEHAFPVARSRSASARRTPCSRAGASTSPAGWCR
jgi:hypothetical protein